LTKENPMDTVTVKTSELIGSALDWAVAKCEGAVDFGYDGVTHFFTLRGETKVLSTGLVPSMCYNPTTDWQQGGPIIEREKFTLVFRDLGHASYWFSEANEPYQENRYISGEGPAPLIAAMRCYVASKLGDTVQIPRELVP
jgi:hypothetical protein